MVHDASEGADPMTREVPAGEWQSFLEGFGREHRAWLATVHVVDDQGARARWARVPLKSATAVGEAVRLEFFDKTSPLCVRQPCALRTQKTAAGLVQALEIDASDGRFIRLAFRATAFQSSSTGLRRARP
jgi:hypothetical protein